MAGCKRCTLKRKKRLKEKKRKDKEKGGKNGDQNRFFLVVFISLQACFFHMYSGHF